MLITTCSPNQPDVIALLNQADAYYAGLYPAESNHLLDIQSLMTSKVIFMTAKSDRLLGIGAIVNQGNYAEVKRMYVVEGVRGQNIGRKLLDSLISNSQHKIIRLETGIKQIAALKLYESAGFYVIEAFEPYKPDPNSIFMELIQ